MQRFRILALASLFVSGVTTAQSAWAAGTGYLFNNGVSSVIETHLADLQNPTTAYTLPGATTTQLTTNIDGLESYSTVPSGSVPTSSSGFQLSDALDDYDDSGVSSTTAAGGAYSITSPSTLFAGFTAGSGVTQNNAGGFFAGSSALNFHVNLFWNLQSQFPAPGKFPGISYQFPLLGNVGAGGNARFLVSIQFYDSAVSPYSIGSININNLYNTPGLVQQTVSGTAILNDGIPLTSGVLEMVGDVTFKAKDPDDPSGFDLSSDATFGSFVSDTPVINQDTSTPLNGVPLPTPILMGILGMAFVALAKLIRNRKLAAA
jgi:hypothetical protein